MKHIDLNHPVSLTILIGVNADGIPHVGHAIPHYRLSYGYTERSRIEAEPVLGSGIAANVKMPITAKRI